MMPPPRRKKWTEAEERTLIDKYGEMVCDGTLLKMKTREKKYKPIAMYVNSIHNSRDPVTYPWIWCWKDVSTKVQNMRHQYSLVKQKVKKSESVGDSGEEDFDWIEGITHWSNFLRYKEVFGDASLLYNNDSVVVCNNENGGGGFVGSNHCLDIVGFGELGETGDGDFAAGIGLEFDYDAEGGEENYNNNNNENTNDNHLKENGESGYVYEDIEPMGSDTRKKRKALKMERRVWGFLTNQLKQLREMETGFEQKEVERENEKQRREKLLLENESRKEEREEKEKVREKLKRQRLMEWEAMEKESDERERRRREEELMYEREWEDRMNRRRSEWKGRIDEMLTQHQVEMGQIQTRILHEQQNLANQLVGLVSQWTGQPAGIADHGGASNHYLSQMMQNLHHVNDIVHEDTRVEGDSHDDQFIVDG